MPVPSFSIDDVSQNEGTGGTTTFSFTVTLDAGVAGGASVQASTADDSAAAASDYTAKSDLLSWGPNESGSKIFTVDVNPDGIPEFDEEFFVNLSSNSAGTGISDNQGIGKILDDDFTPIHTIQGSGLVSPLVGTSVKTAGIVTAVDSHGFYLQSADADADADATTSEAIFVFTLSPPTVAVGDDIEVIGTVSEFTPGGAATRNLSTTQISNVTAVNIQSSANPLPTSTILTPASLDAAVPGVAYFESLEAMLVTAQDLTAVSGTTRFGEIFAVSGTAATGLSSRGTLNISPGDFNPERIQIDEDSDVFDFNFPQVDTGATLGDVTGVLSYAFGNFEIIPTVDFTGNIVASSLTPESSTLAGGPDHLAVASYNVLNLDPNDADGDADIGDGRFIAIADQIVNNLNAPDVIGLQEIQDNNGTQNGTGTGVVSAADTLQLLVDEIAAAGGPSYEFIDNTFIGEDLSGGFPGGNIRTAFLYRADRVDLVPGSVATIDGQGPGQAFEGARLPLVAKFLFNGQEVTIINNHFSSKSGSAPIMGTAQPFETLQEDPTVNGGLDERQAQATAVANFVAGLLAADPATNIMALGDFNEFEFVSPLTILEAAGLANLTNNLPEDERYSNIFTGNSQSLDHILVSPAMTEALFDIVHTNTEFGASPGRASDHDPLLVRLMPTAGGINFIGTDQADTKAGTQFADTMAGRNSKDDLKGEAGDDIIAGQRGRDKIDGGDGEDLIRGGKGADCLTGGADADTFDFNAVKEIGKKPGKRDVIKDFEQGIDTIDLSDIDAKTPDWADKIANAFGANIHKGNQKFNFVGKKNKFSGVEGELRFEYAGKKTVIKGDTDGNGRSEFKLELTGIHVLDAMDFIL